MCRLEQSRRAVSSIAGAWAGENALERPVTLDTRQLAADRLGEELDQVEAADVLGHGNNCDDALDAVAIAVLASEDALGILDDAALLVEDLLGMVLAVDLEVLCLDLLRRLLGGFGRFALDGRTVGAALCLVAETALRGVLGLEALVGLLAVGLVAVPLAALLAGHAVSGGVGVARLREMRRGGGGRVAVWRVARELGWPVEH